MVVYNFYVFSRSGTCLYYAEWNRERNPLKDNMEEDHRLMFGLVFSLQNFVQKLSANGANGDGFRSYRTSSYTLNYFESPSGVRFVLNTDANTSVLRSTLMHIYANIYVPHVVRNPLCKLNRPIKAKQFETALAEYVSNL